MKAVCLLLAMFLLVEETKAQLIQQDGVNIDRYNKIRKQQQPIPQPKGLQQLPWQQMLVQLTHSHSNASGDVYLLPQDNMPMLKPYVNGESIMPTLSFPEQPTPAEGAGKIPNALRLKGYQWGGNDPQRR